MGAYKKWMGMARKAIKIGFIMNYRQLITEIKWLKRQKLKSYKQYREYLHQIRRKELEIAFCNFSKNSSKEEKYEA